MTHDDRGRIRIVLPSGQIEGDCYGWATSAPGNEYEPAGGYTVEWDDGVKDDAITRWYFDGTGLFDIKEV